MRIEYLHDFLLWCLVLNYGILLIWFLLFVFARNWIFKMHTRWFDLPAERFGTLHYSFMAIYKLGILLFNLVPFIVIYILGSGG